MDLKKIGWTGVDWIHLVQARCQWRALVNKIIYLRVQINTGKFVDNLLSNY
jgi:hypothetical protein